jgi:hypothetical protein
MKGEADNPAGLAGVVEAILRVGEERKAVLACLRAALQSGDETQALQLARRLCGLHEEDHRADPRFN